jgi:hypothetical protein
MFGKDIVENITCMITFCDGSHPQVLGALSDKSSPLYSLLPKMGENWYYKFNNSALFESNSSDANNF